MNTSILTPTWWRTENLNVFQLDLHKENELDIKLGNDKSSDKMDTIQLSSIKKIKIQNYAYQIILKSNLFRRRQISMKYVDLIVKSDMKCF